MSAPLLTERFAKDIKGTIECLDRIVLFGTYGSVAYPGAMESLLHLRGVKLIEYTKTHANELRLRMAGHIRELAGREGIDIIQVNASQRKEALVEEPLARRGRKEGVICILGAMESCRNRRYLGFISQWPDRTRERHDLRTITSRVRDAKGRSHRGVDFFREEDLQLLAANANSCTWSLPKTSLSLEREPTGCWEH